MLVELIAHTNDPERTIAAAAKLCYSDAHIDTLLEGLTPEKTAAFLQKLSDVGHASPIEHASFTFGIEGVSRTFLAQVTRHRIGSFSVQSQRYVRLEDFRYVIPPEIEAIPEAKAQFIASMNDDAKKYLELVHTLEDAHTAKFVAQGMDEKAARAKASKQANEDARFVLPNACETKMVMTMNCRSLQNFFNLRCCNRAQWEIRAVADEMLRLVLPLAPHHAALPLEKLGRTYLRVVDYKTGGKEFKLKEVYCGLDCQMLLYLFTLERNAKRQFPGATAAGVEYLLADPAPKSVDRSELGDDADPAPTYPMNGLLLDEESIYRAMDTKGTGEFVPLSFSAKTGKPLNAKSTLADTAKLGRIRDHLDGLLIDMAKNLYGGRIDAEPLCTGGKSPCTYCEFRCACTHRDGEHERTINIKDDPFAE